MNSFMQNLPVDKVNEYKLILVPHQELSDKIMEIREAFNEKFKPDQLVGSLPEVIIVTFKQIPANETRIINRLRIISMGQSPIKVELRDYGSFPGHSVFINVISKGPLGNLIKKISSDAGRLMKSNTDHKPHFFSDFYVAIGRRLKPWQYEQGWLELSNRNFTGRFMASGMLLVRRIRGEFKYKPIAGFDFQNMPVHTQQGELF